jgi:alkaline phosphatase D
VFLTGDIHSSWANDLPLDAATYPVSRTVGTEFVCTSITSDNLDDALNAPPRTTSVGVETAIQATNRHVRYLEFDSHGASVLTVTRESAQMDWFYLLDRTKPDSGVRPGPSWRTRTGTQRVEPVAGPAPVAVRP